MLIKTIDKLIDTLIDKLHTKDKVYGERALLADCSYNFESIAFKIISKLFGNNIEKYCGVMTLIYSSHINISIRLQKKLINKKCIVTDVILCDFFNDMFYTKIKSRYIDYDKRMYNFFSHIEQTKQYQILKYYYLSCLK